MFTSIFTTTSLTITTILTALAVSMLCGLVISVMMRNCFSASNNFLVSIIILPMIVMSVIIMVNGNLGVGVAVAGSFSLVRFRSLPGKSSDIVGLFLAMAAGLACGTGYVTFALTFTIICSIAFALFSKLSFFDYQANERQLRIMIPEDLDFTNIFTDILDKYTNRYRLESVKTVNLGSMYQIQYRVQLKNSLDEKKMLDTLRERNGNLTVSSSLPVSNISEL